MTAKTITLASCMAGNMEYIGRSLAPYLAAKLGRPVRYEESLPWQERERLFDGGAIEMLWVCGLPYVQKAANPEAGITLLAAPVPSGERYGGRPVYFSDIVVHRRSRVRRFEDLRGATWGYNEPHSHSGYTTIRYYLARRGERADFFGRVLQTGAHEASLRMILDGRIDASAIDSTVLELAIARRPTLAGELRIVDSIGPSPIPPLLASGLMEAALLRQVRRILWRMHEDAAGQRLLRAARWARLAPMRDRDYDSLREMTAEASQISFP